MFNDNLYDCSLRAFTWKRAKSLMGRDGAWVMMEMEKAPMTDPEYCTCVDSTDSVIFF